MVRPRGRRCHDPLGWSRRHAAFTRARQRGAMAKQKAYLLVGLPHAGVPLLTAALEEHRDALADQGVRSPAKSVDEMFRAAVEVRREHRAWGLRRRDVEGSWAEVSRRALKHKQPVVLGHELLAGAASDEIALLLDGLAGLQVHVVVLAAPPDPRVGLFPDELDLADVTDRWAAGTGEPGHVHVVVADPHQPQRSWEALGALAGFDATALPLPDPSAVVPPTDADSLRLVAEATAVHVSHDELVDLAEHWAKVVADRGYDVVGDLRDLVPARTSGSSDPARASYEERIAVLNASLVEAVTEIGRLREQLSAAQGKGKRRGLGDAVRRRRERTVAPA
jgi:hypothetical protein